MRLNIHPCRHDKPSRHKPSNHSFDTFMLSYFKANPLGQDFLNYIRVVKFNACLKDLTVLL